MRIWFSATALHVLRESTARRMGTVLRDGLHPTQSLRVVVVTDTVDATLRAV